MTTPQERRQIRLSNDYQEMINIRGSMIEWRPLSGIPPYVDEYELTLNIRSIIAPGPQYREQHKVILKLPSDYPKSPPYVMMVDNSKVFHPNWFVDGRWCFGSWDISEGLGYHILRMIKTLQFDPQITNPSSPANRAANDWYQSNEHRGWFPCDHQPLPDPSRKKFQIHSAITPPSPPKKTFKIN